MNKATIPPESDGLREYEELLHMVQTDLNTLIYEIESRTVNHAGTDIPKDILFDCVPILRKLKDARKYTEESIRHHQAKLAK